jgi:hypothetical protein
VTHTFLKRNERDYTVGQWLRAPEGFDRFEPLVSVTTMRGAIRLAALLNGGTGMVDAVLLRAGVMTDPIEDDSNGEDHEATAKRAALVRRARARPARDVV